MMAPVAIVVTSPRGTWARFRAWLAALTGPRAMPPTQVGTLRWHRLTAPTLLAWAKSQHVGSVADVHGGAQYTGSVEAGWRP